MNILLKDWSAWCETIRNKDFDGHSPKNRNIYHDLIELSAQKRAYKRTGIFSGCFDKGFIPVDYSVEWTGAVRKN